MAEPTIPSTSSEIVFYQGEDGRSRLQVRLDGGTVWLTQRLLAELYQVSVPTINEHIKNIYADAELDPAATIRKFRLVQVERKRQVSRLIDHYDAQEEGAVVMGPVSQRLVEEVTAEVRRQGRDPAATIRKLRTVRAEAKREKRAEESP